MKTKQSDIVEQVIAFRVNADTLKAIQKSGQSARDWFRQAARNRLEGERNSANPHDAADGANGPAGTRNGPTAKRNREAPAIGTPSRKPR